MVIGSCEAARYKIVILILEWFYKPHVIFYWENDPNRRERTAMTRVLRFFRSLQISAFGLRYPCTTMQLSLKSLLGFFGFYFVSDFGI